MGTPLRVLIVEDSEEDTLLMLRELKRGGFDPVHERVETAESMQAALSTKTWDLILADYSMPHFSGLEALKLLRKSKLDLPFIIVSGSIGEDIAVAAMKAGAHDYIMKNNLAKLVPAIERELRDAVVRRERKQAEKAFKDSERLSWAVLETAPSLIVLTDAEGHIFLFNRACEELTGYKREEVIGKTIPELFLPPEWIPIVQKRFADPYAPEVRVPHENPWRTKSGEERLIEWRCTVLPSPVDGSPHILGTGIDITERKRAQEAVTALLTRQEALLAAVPDIIMEVDHNKVYTWANRAGFEFFGGDVIGKEAAQYFEGEQDTYGVVQPLFEGDENVFYVESWQRRRDGQKRLLGWWCRVLKDESGNVTGALSSAQDISERKLAEERLRLQSAALEAAANAIIITDHEGMIVWANPAFTVLTGYSHTEVVGRNPRELIKSGKQNQPFYKDLWDTILAGKVWRGQIINRRKDGSVYTEEMTITPLRNEQGKISRFIAIKQDITDRKQAEQALFDSEQRYRNLVDNAPDVIFTLAPDGKLTSLNPAFERITGWPRSEWLDKQFALILHPDDLPRALDLIQRVLRGEKVAPFQLEVLSKSGEYLVAEITVSPQTQNESVIGILGIARDITERKRAEEAIRESEKRYRQVVENATEIIYTIDEKGNFTYANPAGLKVTGYSLGELRQLNYADIVLPEHRERVSQIYISQFSERLPNTYVEFPFFSKVGEIIWFGQNSTLVMEEDKIVGFHIIARDITERKRAREALQESEKRYRGLFDGMPIGIYRTNSRGEILDANPALVEMLGYPDRESLSKVKAVDTDADPEERKRWLTLMEQGGIVRSFQRHLRRRDGSTIWVEENARVFRDAESEGLYHYEGSFQDITERKQAEEALRRSEREAKQLAQENATMAEIGRIVSSTLDIEEIYESFSKEARKLISFDRVVINMIDTEKGTVRNAYIAGKGLQDRNIKDVYPLEGSGNAEMVRTKSTLLIQTEDFNEYRDRFPMLLSTFQAGFRSIMNVPLFSKGKIIGGLLLRSREPYAYTDKDVKLAERIGSQIAGAIANAQLFTESLRAEEEKAALQEQLRQSQKMEAIGRLAGGVAHDFNNLLTIIKGNSELSLMDVKEDDPIRENLKGVLRASGRASGLIRQLLAFSRRQILEMKVLDLNSLLMDLDKMLHRLIGEDIELVILPCKDLGRVKADAGQIEQVILNLAVNSRDAMPSGGRLTIETANVELDKEYARRHIAVIPGRYVMLSVSDTGAGMTPEVRDKVFEPFFTTKESSKGTGLGLSTVYGIVKQSGGNIWVYSEPGKGATFKIYLPRVDEPLGEVVREKAMEAGIPRGSETILIVEDDEDVREVAVRILKTQGYRVLERSNGSDAFHCGEQEAGPIHLMVTDVIMPGMNGPELAKRINPLRPKMKVLYISGYTDNAIVHHGVLEKGVNYIQKPFTVEGLARKVREVLDQ